MTTHLFRLSLTGCLLFSGCGSSSVTLTDSAAGTTAGDDDDDDDDDVTNDTDETDTDTTPQPTGCESGPLPDPVPGCAPPVAALSGDFGQDCVDRINQFRWVCQCLPPLARWNDAESCTDQQSADDQASGIAHDNFGACGENAQNTCPNWGSEGQIIDSCLQMMWDEGPGEPFAEHGHYINMSSLSYSKVACGRSSNGGVWSNQNFKP